MADKILPQRIRELVPESQAYMDLLAFERKLDQTIMRKRVDIQEALKRPMKQKRKLRLYISNTFNPAKPDAEDSDGSIASWELRVEGKLLDDPSKQKRKFSSFFKSLVIELDKDLYGPDNHLVEVRPRPPLPGNSHLSTDHRPSAARIRSRDHPSAPGPSSPDGPVR